MPIVKINEPGFDQFNGDIGGTMFENGVSVESVGERDVQRLSASMRIETLEGKQLGIAARLVENACIPASLELESTVTADGVQDNEGLIVGEEPDASNVNEAQEGYTRSELEQIADEKGIAGLRGIAAPMNVKGVSILALIDGILRKQKGE